MVSIFFPISIQNNLTELILTFHLTKFRPEVRLGYVIQHDLCSMVRLSIFYNSNGFMALFQWSESTYEKSTDWHQREVEHRKEFYKSIGKLWIPMTF